MNQEYIDLYDHAKNIIEQMTMIRKNFRENGQDIIKAYAQKLFENCPYLIMIQWKQYTPYFMDGDPCIFGIQDIEFFFSKKPYNANIEYDFESNYYLSTDDTDEENYIEIAYGFCSYEIIHILEIINKERPLESYENPNSLEYIKNCANIIPLIKEFESLIYVDPSLMQETFGDHAKITITRQELSVNKYQHD